MLRPLNNGFLPNQQPQSSNPMAMMQNPQHPNPPMGMLAANQPGSSAQMGQRFQVRPQRQGPPGPGMQSQMPFSSPPNAVPMHGIPSGQPQVFSHSHQPQQGAIRRVTSQPNLQQGVSQLAMGSIPPSLGMNPQSNLHGQLRHQPQNNQLQQQSRQQHQQHPHPHQHQQQHQHQTGHMHNSEMTMGTGSRQGHPPMPNSAQRQTLSQPQLMNSLAIPPGHNPMMQSQPNTFQGNSISGPLQPPQASISPRPGSQPSHMPNGIQANNANNLSRMAPESMFMFSNPSVQGSPGIVNPRTGQHPFNPSMSSDNLDTGINHSNGPLYMGGPRANMDYGDNVPQGLSDRFDSNLSNMGTPNVPPRPPSSLNPSLTPGPIQHHSPSHHMSSSPPHSSGPIPRPSSQPQAMNHSQPIASQTPRPQVNHLGPGSLPPRLPPANGSSPMPLNPSGSSTGGRQMQPGQGLQSTIPVESNMRIPNRLVPVNPGSSAPSLGDGQGLMRLLNFSALLSDSAPEKLQSSWWNDTIDRYFTQTSHMKLTLWKDNQQQEAKIFEINKYIIPQFFLATMQSGVRAMTLALDGARERLQTVGHAVVECPKAVWTCKYANGFIVTLSGPLTVRVVVCTPAQNVPPGMEQPSFVLKFEQFVFDAVFHEKYINVESIQMTKVAEPPKTPRQRNAATPVPNGPPAPPTSGTPQNGRDETNKRPWEEPRFYCERASWPGEPVNAFGIPQATMRVLELAESVASMTDLITFSNDHNMGPIAALKQFATNIRESNPALAAMNSMAGYPNGHIPPGAPPFPDAAHTSAGSLYAGSSSNPPMASNSIASMAASPKNPSGSASNSPQKQHKTIPQRPGSAQAAGVTSANTQASSITATSIAPPTSLKRKQAPSDTGTSPTTANSDQPPAKRGNRKRRPTSTGA
jgi:hypothetical protein